MLISKSKYLKGLQCHKALWLSYFKPDLAPEPDPKTLARFESGQEVGEWAKRRFPGGVEIAAPHNDIEAGVSQTENLINQGHEIIFEATAQTPDRMGHAKADILKKVDGMDAWDMIEVKSSTKVKDYHIDDMAFQYFVFKQTGYEVRKCELLLIDSSYVRSGDIDPHALFASEDVTGLVLEKQAEIADLLSSMQSILLPETMPDVDIGNRCSKPFDCEYREYCWKHVPEYSIYDVFAKPKAEKLVTLYGVDLESLPRTEWPKGKVLDIESYLSKKVHIDKGSLMQFLGQIQYPLHFLDYETINPAIPLFDRSRPYQHIPFQFSLHVQASPGASFNHIDFLHCDRSNPRLEFIEALVNACGSKGSIVVYYEAFEKTRNRELAVDFPEYKEQLIAINDRIVDLFKPFKERWLYSPTQNGSASIKDVLPCFTDESYEGLAIKSGDEAMLQYGAFLAGKIEEEELSRVWHDLLEYCKLDTWGMVLLLEAIEQQANQI